MSHADDVISNHDALIRVLYIEDDVRLARMTAQYLDAHGVQVTWCEDGRRGLSEALAHRYDAVLLDRMLPSMNGVEVCRQLRTRSEVPILMLTAQDEDIARAFGVERGADDYLAKPFTSRELVNRVRSLVRRARGDASSNSRVLRVGTLVIDTTARSATLNGRVLPLTSLEFVLLQGMARHPGHVLSRDQLLELVHGNTEDAFDRSIDVHVSRLRHKLGDDPRAPQWLKTVRGAGYMLVQQSA